MLEKWEKKFGKYAIKNLILYILGGYIIGYILYFLTITTSFHLYEYLTLSPAMVMRGQVWRLFTWVFTVPSGFSIFLIFMFLLYYFIGKALDQALGSFRYNLYIFMGWFFMTIGAMLVYWVSYLIAGPTGAISYSPSTYYINLTSFLLFAMIFPQARIYFFGILPIRAKILAIIDLVYLGLQVLSAIVLLIMAATPNGESIAAAMGMTKGIFVQYMFEEIFSILFSILNFLVFYLASRDLKRLSPREVQRRTEYKKSVQRGQDELYRNQNEKHEETEERPKIIMPELKRKNQEPNPHAGNKYSPDKGAGMLVHKCAICGRTSIDHPELSFRYCSKCNGNYEYCQDHLFTHEHVK